MRATRGHGRNKKDIIHDASFLVSRLAFPVGLVIFS